MEVTSPSIFKLYPPKNPNGIQLYTSDTPNGLKPVIALLEMKLEFEAHLIDMTKKEQFTTEYISLQPNSKIPALIDTQTGASKKIQIMESGAILLYLGEKNQQFIPAGMAAKNECLQWMFFQVGHIGPMFGQFSHFYKFAKEECKDPYPLQRYQQETKRLLGVLNARLKKREYILDFGYSIADMMIYPWLETLLGFYDAGDAVEIHQYPHAQHWFTLCGKRDAVQQAIRMFKDKKG